MAQYKTSKKMAKRKLERSRRFFDSAIALFGQFGYHAVTVPMIVAKAEGSTGAFYLYFHNKEDVYAEALREIGARLATALTTAIACQTEVAAQMG